MQKLRGIERRKPKSKRIWTLINRNIMSLKIKWSYWWVSRSILISRVLMSLKIWTKQRLNNVNSFKRLITIRIILVKSSLQPILWLLSKKRLKKISTSCLSRKSSCISKSKIRDRSFMWFSLQQMNTTIEVRWYKLWPKHNPKEFSKE